MTASPPPPSPEKITGRLITAFQSAALLAALQLEVFTALDDKALTGEELAAVLGVRPRRLLPILNVLRLIELLRLEGDRYTNSPEAAHYLIKGKPSYIGHTHELYASMYQAVLATAESIRTDRAAAEHNFDRMSDRELAAFFRGLHGLSVLQGRNLAKQHDFTRFAVLGDVGGGAGSIAIGACEACPGIQAVVFELDRVVPIARQIIAEAHLADRITALPCDITKGPPSVPYDVAIARSLLQVLAPEHAAIAARHIGHSLQPGGELYVLGYILDDARAAPWEAAAWDVAFVNIYGAGQAYTEGEYRAWLTAAGFGTIERNLLPNKMSLITARKL